MQTHPLSTRRDEARRPGLLVLAGLLAGLGLSACSPVTTAGLGGSAATGTGVTGTSAGTISPAGASTVTRTTGTPAGSLLAAPSTDPGSGPGSRVATTARDNTTLATLLASDDRFTTLGRLVRLAGLSDTLAGGQYTIFAPTDDAFLKLSPSDLDALTADPGRLRRVLLYHVVPGRVSGTALATTSRFTTVQSGVLTVSRPSGEKPDSPIRTLINGAILQADASIPTGNGVVYPIDSVLLPPSP